MPRCAPKYVVRILHRIIIYNQFDALFILCMLRACVRVCQTECVCVCVSANIISSTCCEYVMQFACAHALARTHCTALPTTLYESVVLCVQPNQLVLENITSYPLSHVHTEFTRNRCSRHSLTYTTLNKRVRADTATCAAYSDMRITVQI